MILTDGKVSLRPFTERHADRRYLDWFRTPAIRRFITHRPNTIAEARAYVTAKLLDHGCRFFSIYLGKKRVGTLKLDGEVGRTWWLGLMVGEPSARGQGIGPRAIWLGCCYAFDVLKAEKVLAGIDHANKASVRAFQKAGFNIATDPDRMVAWKVP